MTFWFVWIQVLIFEISLLYLGHVDNLNVQNLWLAFIYGNYFSNKCFMIDSERFWAFINDDERRLWTFRILQERSNFQHVNVFSKANYFTQLNQIFHSFIEFLTLFSIMKIKNCQKLKWLAIKNAE